MQIMLSSQSDIITCAQEVEMMIKQLEAQLEQLKLTVKSKTAVPTSQVFVSICHMSGILATWVPVGHSSDTTCYLHPHPLLG